MEKINIFSRLFRSVSDFEFANVFIKEKTGKAFGFMIFCFLMFSIVALGFYVVKVQSSVDVIISDSEKLLNSMPDFEITPNGFEFTDGTKTGFYENESIAIYVDLNEDSQINFLEKSGKVVMHIDESSLYLNDTSFLEYGTLSSNFNRSEVITALKTIDIIAKIAFVVALIMAFIILLILSLFNWVFVIVINAIFKKDILAGDCFKIGVYAMTLPNIIWVGLTFTGTQIPGFMLVYLALVAFYSYMFMKNYKADQEDILEIFEEEF